MALQEKAWAAEYVTGKSIEGSQVYIRGTMKVQKINWKRSVLNIIKKYIL